MFMRHPIKIGETHGRLAGNSAFGLKGEAGFEDCVLIT
mgnify:CR=1 FL=1